MRHPVELHSNSDNTSDKLQGETAGTAIPSILMLTGSPLRVGRSRRSPTGSYESSSMFPPIAAVLIVSVRSVAKRRR
jgi:hypothetical protein